MTLAQLTLKDLKGLQKLLSKKAALESQIDTLNRQLSGFKIGGTASTTAKRPKRRRRKKAVAKTKRKPTRKGIKAPIIAELKMAGKEGIAVKDLAKKLKTKVANVRVWFYTTGKKVKEIKKAGPAKYCWGK